MDIYEELDIDTKGGFVYDYSQNKETFDKQKINEYSRKKLEKWNEDFSNLSCRIIKLSKEYFKKILDNDKNHNNERYFDLANIYISEIQNVYLNRINYRLNQKNVKVSFWVGLISIIIGIIIGIGSIMYSHFNPTQHFCYPSETNDTARIKTDTFVDKSAEETLTSIDNKDYTTP